MADPNLHETGIFGVKAGTILFGFIGAAVSLSYIKQLTPRLALAALATGLGVSVACTPLVAFFAHIPEGGRYEYGIAFLLGLTSMHLVPGVVKLAEMFKKNPQSIIKGGD